MNVLDWLFGQTPVQNLETPTPAPETPDEVRETMRMFLLSSSDRLPTAATAIGFQITDLHEQAYNTSHRLASRSQFTLRRMLEDYLPNLLEAYMRAPDGQEEDLIRNMATMVEAVTNIQQAVDADNQSALDTEGRFLDKRFGVSSLE